MNIAAPMTNQDYKYDVFISYRRDKWQDWVRNVLKADLEQCLADELGESKVFIDERMEGSGTLWPEELKDALASSRVILPVLSMNYFISHWCRLELSLMFERERVCKLRQFGNRRGVILPIRIADGNHFPSSVRQLEPAKWHDFANPHMAPSSPIRERLFEEVRNLTHRLIELIQSAPEFDPSWRSFDEGTCREHYDACSVDVEAVKRSQPRLR